MVCDAAIAQLTSKVATRGALEAPQSQSTGTHNTPGVLEAPWQGSPAKACCGKKDASKLLQ